MFDIIINNKTYEYINACEYEGKSYVLYKDENDYYISEYIMNNEKIEFKEVNDELLDVLKGVFSYV